MKNRFVIINMFKTLRFIRAVIYVVCERLVVFQLQFYPGGVNFKRSL